MHFEARGGSIESHISLISPGVTAVLLNPDLLHS